MQLISLTNAKKASHRSFSICFIVYSFPFASLQRKNAEIIGTAISNLALVKYVCTPVRMRCCQCCPIYKTQRKPIKRK